jgi:hypothetical protein
MRIIIVGINPAKGSPRIKGTLSRLAFWMDAASVRHWSFTNCIFTPGSYSYKDVDYKYLSQCVAGYNKVVALGKFPSKALSELGINHHMLPHPSRLNRKLNDAEYEKYQVKLYKEYIHG